MTTKLKKAKITWSPDEPGTLWGFTTDGKPGPTASYFVRVNGIGRYCAGVYPPKCLASSQEQFIGMYSTQEEAKAACAVDALKYI